MNATLVLLFLADQFVARSTGSSVWIPRMRVSETMRYNQAQRVPKRPEPRLCRRTEGRVRKAHGPLGKLIWCEAQWVRKEVGIQRPCVGVVLANVRDSVSLGLSRHLRGLWLGRSGRATGRHLVRASLPQ